MRILATLTALLTLAGLCQAGGGYPQAIVVQKQRLAVQAQVQAYYPPAVVLQQQAHCFRSAPAVLAPAVVAPSTTIIRERRGLFGRLRARETIIVP